MKSIRKENFKTNKDKVGCRIERTILEKLKSPFVVRLHYAFQTPDKVYFVVDYMPGGELFNHLHNSFKFKEKQTKFYISQGVLALKDMHKIGIIYRDLKLENIMLDQEGNIKITDFGLSKLNVKNDKMTYSFVGTPEYLAPEIVKGGGHGKQADWWSLGAIMYEMLSGKSLFYNKNVEKTLDNILFKDIIIPNSFSSKAKKLVEGLLGRNPFKRLGAKRDAAEIMEDPFFKDIDWVALRKKEIKPPFKPKTLGSNGIRYFSQKFLEEEPVDSMVTSLLNLDQKKENHFEAFTYLKDNNILTQERKTDSSHNLSRSLPRDDIIWDLDSSMNQ